MADALISSTKSEHTVHLISLCRICGKGLTERVIYNLANYNSRLQSVKMPFNEDREIYPPSFCNTCYTLT